MERRRHARCRAFKAGSASSQGRSDATPCVVRDLAEGGALLLVDEPQRMPTAFALTFAQGGGVEQARVVWRGECAVGVAFDRALASAASPPVVPSNVLSLDGARRGKALDLGSRRFADRMERVVLRHRPPEGSKTT